LKSVDYVSVSKSVKIVGGFKDDIEGFVSRLECVAWERKRGGYM